MKDINFKNFLFQRFPFSKKGLKKYFYNTSWIFFGRIGSLLLSLFVVSYLARYLGPNNYGALSYAMGFVGLFSFIASFGTDQVVYREIIELPDKEEEILGTAIVLRFLTSLIAFGIITLVSLLIHEISQSFYLILLISISFIFQPFYLFNYAFQARLESRKPAIISFSINIFLSILKLLIIFFDKGIFYLGSIFVIESILYSSLYIYFYQKSYKKIKLLRYRSVLIKRIAANSIPFALATCFMTIYARIDQIIIKHLITNSAVGIYDAAVRFSEVWVFVPGIIVSSLFPAIVNARKTSLILYRKRLINLSQLLIALSVLITVFSLIFAPFLINIFFGEAYNQSVLTLQIYIFSIFGISIGTVITQHFITLNNKKMIVLYPLAISLVNIVLNLLLIPKYQIYGAAFSSVLTYSLSMLPFIFIINSLKSS